MRNLILIALFATSCHTKTALDIQSCLNRSVAAATQPIIGLVASTLLGATSVDQAKSDVLILGTQYGIAAVTCAIDTVIRDLGGDSKTPKTTANAIPSVAQKAIFYGREARTALHAKK